MTSEAYEMLSHRYLAVVSLEWVILSTSVVLPLDLCRLLPNLFMANSKLKKGMVTGLT